MAQTKLVKGDKLTPEARKQVLAAFIYRNTKENEVRSKKVQPKVDCSQSDDQWLASHAFYITADGRLSDREKKCEPASMANESEEDFGSEIEYKGKHYYPFWDDVDADELISNTLANSEGLDVDMTDLKLVKGKGPNMEAVNKSGLIVAVLDTRNSTAYMIAESKVNESIDTNISTELLSSQTLDTGTKLNKGDKVTIDITDKPGSTFRLISVSVDGKHVGYVETETPGSIFKLDGITNESDNSVWVTGETMLRSKNPDHKGKAYPFANIVNGTDVYVYDGRPSVQMLLGKESDVEVVNESVNESASTTQGGFSDAVWKVPFLQKYINESPVFGYVGNESRTMAHDKLVERILRELGCNDMMIAAFIISTDGRIVDVHYLDTPKLTKIFNHFIKFNFDGAPDDWKQFQKDSNVFKIFESAKPGKKINESQFTVSLSNVGNIDHGADPTKTKYGTKDDVKSVSTYKDAIEACKSYIKDNDLGAGNWTGGDIQINGKTVAKISYNGRAWDISGKEITDVAKPITESKRVPLPTFESFKRSIKIQEATGDWNETEYVKLWNKSTENQLGKAFVAAGYARFLNDKGEWSGPLEQHPDGQKALYTQLKKIHGINESEDTADSVLTKVFGSNIVADDISKNWDIKRKSISDDSKVKEFVDGLKADGYKTKTKKNSDFTYVVGVKAKANESRINEDQVIYYVNMSIDASIKMKPEGSKDLEYLLEMQKDLPMIAALADNKNFAGKCVAYRVEVDTARATIAFWIENVISGKPIPPEMESRIAASFGKFGKRFRIIKHKPTSWLVAMEYSVGAGSTTPKTEISRVIGESKSMNEAKGAEFEELIDELFSNSKTPNMKMLKGASTGIYDKVTAILWNYFDKGDIKSWEDAEMKVSNDPKIGEILATIEESLKLQESFSFEGTSLNAVQELKVDSKRITSKDEGGFIRVYVDGKEIYMCSNDSTVSKKLKPLLDVISKQTQVTFTMCEGTGDGKEYNHSGPGLFIYMESLLICRTCKLKKRDGMDAPAFNMLRTTAKSIGLDTSKLPDWAV